MKIIFLDIDGVLTSTKSLLMPDNVDVYKKVENEKNVNIKEVALKLEFDKMAIMLINRLAEYSGAKIVISSNWRRNIGVENTYNKLLEQGIKKENFHEDYYTISKMSSEKIHEIGFWLSDHPEVKEYVILDDHDISYNYEGMQVLTSFDEGFSVYDYRIALGYLKGKEDKELDVYFLDDSTINEIKQYGDLAYLNNSRFYEIIYGRPDRSMGIINNLAALLSYNAAHNDNLETSSLFLPQMSTVDLFNSRKNRAINILKDF